MIELHVAVRQRGKRVSWGPGTADLSSEERKPDSIKGTNNDRPYARVFVGI